MEADALERLTGLFPPWSEELGIDLETAGGRFRWFVASLLFGKRISSSIAAKTFLGLDAARILESPDTILETGWQGLVDLLDAGGYVRYDFSTATKLLNIMDSLKREYGDTEGLYLRASDEADLERRLLEFKGIGPTTAGIFLRELRGTWRVEPEVCEAAREATERLGIALSRLKGKSLARVETALVRLYHEFCSKAKCAACPLGDCCALGRQARP
jgi:hypothetical protein